jgi:hypothetical protein
MKLTNILLLSTLVLASLLFSCDDDELNDNACLNTNCPEGFVGVLNVDVCECVPSGTGSGIAGTVNVAGLISDNTTWTNDNVYVLSGRVVVDGGAKLTIEAGTLIKGAVGTGTLASTLIIARGSQIEALGTATSPIIFTSVLDNITPGQILSPNLSEDDNALWGGLIILGNAPVSAANGDAEAQIEGIPADDLFGRYGGDDEADNSGIIQYISVRHGGALIGEDNEINGITFGGVGNGTLVENIEVVANLDDGVEWFGGTVNARNVIVANGEDDGLDIDQNYSGTISNAVVIQSGATVGDNAIEIDGPEGTTYTEGFFTIDGLTLIDEDGGADQAGDLKSKTQGTIRNASWRGYNTSDNLVIRYSCESSDCSTPRDDSFSYFIEGRAQILDSEWVGEASLSDWTSVYGDRDCDNEERCDVSDADQAAITNLLSDGGNIISATPTKGADMSVFADWTWAAAQGKLN